MATWRFKWSFAHGSWKSARESYLHAGQPAQRGRSLRCAWRAPRCHRRGDRTADQAGARGKEDQCLTCLAKRRRSSISIAGAIFPPSGSTISSATGTLPTTPDNAPWRHFLGLTDEEYAIWLMDPDTLPQILLARPTERRLKDVVADYVAAMRGAARPEDRSALYALGHWLGSHPDHGCRARRLPHFLPRQLATAPSAAVAESRH